MPNLDLLRSLEGVLSFWPNNMKKYSLLGLYETKYHCVRCYRHLCLLEQLAVLLTSNDPYNVLVHV